MSTALTRLCLLGLLPSLAACAGGTPTSELTPATAPAAATPESAASPAPASTTRRAPAAARVANAPPQPAPPPEPLTREQASAQCWMKVEKNLAVRDLDARLKLVEKCTVDKMSAQPPSPPTP